MTAPRSPEQLDAAGLAFTRERHLATLTTLRPDGSPHVAPVGFTWDPDSGLARIITFASATKVRNVRDSPGRASVCQVDGGRWLTLEGQASVTTDRGRCRDAERRYGERYREPEAREDRAVIEIRVDRLLGRW